MPTKPENSSQKSLSIYYEISPNLRLHSLEAGYREGGTESAGADMLRRVNDDAKCHVPNFAYQLSRDPKSYSQWLLGVISIWI